MIMVPKSTVIHFRISDESRKFTKLGMQSHREDTKSLLQCQNGQFITIMVQILNIYHNFGIKTVNLSQLWYVSVRFITIVAMTTNLLQIWTKLPRPRVVWAHNAMGVSRCQPICDMFIITILRLLGARCSARPTTISRSAKVGVKSCKNGNNLSKRTTVTFCRCGPADVFGVCHLGWCSTETVSIKTETVSVNINRVKRKSAKVLRIQDPSLHFIG